MIYKGKNKCSRSATSYRPISLANSIYKPYASLLHLRLSRFIDPLLSSHQYGFRSGKSLSTPLFLLRRLTEIFERRSAPLHILFLYWSQAFDSISHTHLQAALIRYGVSPHFTSAVMALYHNSRFFVNDLSIDSSHFTLGRGIKQGCPLSPYLFIVVLSALTYDLNENFSAIFNYTPWTYSSNHPSTDFEYADDTVLMARSNETLMRLLHLLQQLASRIGLILNGSKCQLLSIHSTLPISLFTSAYHDNLCDCPYCHLSLGFLLIPRPFLFLLLL